MNFRGEMESCEGMLIFDELFWGSLEDQLAATIASFRTKVNDIIGVRDDIEVVLNDNNRVALI